MAYEFLLAAECGMEKSAAEMVARYFDGKVVVLGNGSRFPCVTQTRLGKEAWWACVYPEGTKLRGGDSDLDTEVLTEAGHALYEFLRAAPPYRYAMAGIEVFEIRTYSRLGDVAMLDFNGMVLSDTVWQHLGSPEMYVPFETGYRWWPFVVAD